MGIGEAIYQLCEELFPINRSLTGDGVRQTFQILQREIPDLVTYEVPTGTACFDWTVPKEWNCQEAYIIDPNGHKICDFSQNNLHVLGYSYPVETTLSLAELQHYLYSKPELPEAIPYVTSYYTERWGFCLSHQQRESLPEGNYQVYINSTLEDGHLTYGEVLIPGETEEEIFFSTYICHPSMANNELSGPTVATYLIKYLQSLPSRRYSYRFVFIPETIGSIVYLSRNLNVMKERTVAGFNLTCVGDNHTYSYLPSRDGNTLADKAAQHVLKHHYPDYQSYTFLDRGSDERQYCWPNVDLPLCSMMRSKFMEYPEYHTSLDNLDYISPEGLYGAYEIHTKVIEALEHNHYYEVATLCEPQLGKRGLYPTLSKGVETRKIVRNMMNFLAYCDGKKDIIDIAEIIEVAVWELYDIIQNFEDHALIHTTPIKG